MNFKIHQDARGWSVCVAYIQGAHHRRYQDRYRLLSKEVPLVASHNRGEVFGVFDGIGGAPRGMEAAQLVCDHLSQFFQRPKKYDPSPAGLNGLLFEANLEIFNWGFITGTEIPQGQCSGSVIWVHKDKVNVFHAGDTAIFLVRDDLAISLTQTHVVGDLNLNYFGIGQAFQIDTTECRLKLFNRLLMLTNGVTDVLSGSEAASLIENHGELCRAAAEVVRSARLRGSKGDLSALLVEPEIDED